MKKRVFLVFGIVIVALVVSAIALVANLGKMVKASVEKLGLEILGVSVTLDDVDLHLLKGTAALHGLVVGNPDEFKTPHAIRLRAMTADIDLRSLKTDTVIIEEIRIDAPELMLELGLKKTNVGVLMKNAKGATATAQQDREAPPQTKSGTSTRKVVIHHVVVTGGSVGLSSRIQEGKVITMSLPKIEMSNIGKDVGGTSFASASSLILETIYKQAVQVVASSGNLTGDMLMSFGGVTFDMNGGMLEGLGAGLGSVGPAANSRSAESKAAGTGEPLGGGLLDQGDERSEKE